MITWTHNFEYVYTRDDMPEDAMGFIYEITYTNGQKYIGKKNLWSERILAPLKGQKRKRKVKKETNWKVYSGSHKNKSGLVIASREILFYAISKRELTYMEVREQFLRDVLFSKQYLNENIGGKFFDTVHDKLKGK